MLTLCFVVPRARARNWRCSRSSIDSLFFWLAQRRCKYLVLKTLSFSRTPSPFMKLWYCATADCLDSLIFQRKFNILISTKPCVSDCRSSFLPLSNSPYCINNRSIYRKVVNKMVFLCKSRFEGRRYGNKVDFLRKYTMLIGIYIIEQQYPPLGEKRERGFSACPGMDTAHVGLSSSLCQEWELVTWPAAIFVEGKKGCETGDLK